MQKNHLDYSDATRLVDSVDSGELAREILGDVPDSLKIRAMPIYKAFVEANIEKGEHSSVLINKLEDAAGLMSDTTGSTSDIMEILGEEVPNEFMKLSLLIEIVELFGDDVCGLARWVDHFGFNIERRPPREHQAQMLRSAVDAVFHQLDKKLQSHYDVEDEQLSCECRLVHRLTKLLIRIFQNDLQSCTENQDSQLAQCMKMLGNNTQLNELIEWFIEEIEAALKNSRQLEYFESRIKTVKEHLIQLKQSSEAKVLILNKYRQADINPVLHIQKSDKELLDMGIVRSWEYSEKKYSLEIDSIGRLQRLFGNYPAESEPFVQYLLKRSELSDSPAWRVTHTGQCRIDNICIWDILSVISANIGDPTRDGNERPLLVVFLEGLIMSCSDNGRKWEALWTVRYIFSRLKQADLAKSIVDSCEQSNCNGLGPLQDYSVVDNAFKIVLEQWKAELPDFNISDEALIGLAITESVNQHVLQPNVAELLISIIVSAMDADTVNVIESDYIDSDDFVNRVVQLQRYIGLEAIFGDIDQCTDRICRMFQTIAHRQLNYIEKAHPVARIFHAFAHIVYPHNPKHVRRCLNEWQERLSPDAIEYIFSTYDPEEYTDIAPFILAEPSINDEERAYEIPDYNRRDHNSSQSYPAKKPSVKGIQKIADGLFEYLCDIDDHQINKEFNEIAKLSYCDEVYSFLEASITDQTHDLEKRLRVFGYIIGYGCNNYPSDQKTVVAATFQRELEPQVARCAHLYPRYLEYCNRTSCSQKYLDDNELVKRYAKCLSLLRRRIVDQGAQWTINEYMPCLEGLAKASQFDQIFKQLMLAYRASIPVSALSAVKVPWGEWQHTMLTNQDQDRALNWLLASWLPHSIMRERLQDCQSREEAELAAMSTLCNAVYDFCISSLKLKKKEKLHGGGYRQSQCKEQSTHWRKGLLNALRELRRNTGGEAHRIANFVANHDFDSDTRELASQVHIHLRKFKPYKEYREVHRSYLAAIWWLRLARADACDLEIDMLQAKRWRRRELRYIK